jgi:hypothetical protein
VDHNKSGVLLLLILVIALVIVAAYQSCHWGNTSTETTRCIAIENEVKQFGAVSYEDREYWNKHCRTYSLPGR